MEIDWLYHPFSVCVEEKQMQYDWQALWIKKWLIFNAVLIYFMDLFLSGTTT